MKGFIKVSVFVFLLLLGIAVFAQAPEEKNEGVAKHLIESPISFRGDSLNCELVGGWFSGPCGAIFVDSTKDTLAFIGDGGYLRILNVSDPSSPTTVGKLKCPRVIKDIYVKDSFVYIADGESGIRIINATDPTNPVEIGFYDTGDWAYGVHVVDSLAYIANYEGGLYVINVSDPTNPTEIGFYDTGGNSYDVHVVDSLAYVANYEDGLYVINTSDPTNPTEIGSYDTGNCAYGAYVVDSLAYVADGSDGLRIINASDPTSPVEIPVRWRLGSMIRGTALTALT